MLPAGAARQWPAAVSPLASACCVAAIARRAEAQKEEQEAKKACGRPLKKHYYFVRNRDLQSCCVE